MITKKIKVKKAKELKNNGNTKSGVAGFFLALPWCCITPAAFSLLGFFGAAGAARGFVTEILYPLLALSLLFLGRANYLSLYNKRESRTSRMVVLISSVAALTFWAIRFRLADI